MNSLLLLEAGSARSSREKRMKTRAQVIKEAADRNTLGIVFSGGGLSGIAAESGSLLALNDIGITYKTPRATHGTSAGAMVSGLWRSGISAHRCANIFASVQLEDYWKPVGSRVRLAWGIISGQLTAKTGWSSGEPLRNWLAKVLRENTLPQNYQPRTYFSAADVTGTRPCRFVMHKDAPVERFIRASTAIPFVFELEPIPDSVVRQYGNLPELEPYPDNDPEALRWFADGGVSDNVPVDELVAAHPELDTILVVTPLRRQVGPRPYSPSNRFMDEDWTPIRMLDRMIEAAVHGMEESNMRAGAGRRVLVLSNRIDKIGLLEPEKLRRGIAQGYSNAASWLDDLDE